MKNPFLKCFLWRPVRRLLPVMAALLSFVVARAAEVPICVSPDTTVVERCAAEDLARYLGRIYPSDRFALTNDLPQSGRAIVVGCASNVVLRGLLGPDVPMAAESFQVVSRKDELRQLGIIAGADARGVAYGVCALLEKLGCGFYMSYDTFPPASREPFSFAGWQLSDAPLVRDRIVFNWHNFLSGCSTWNLPEWKAWIEQSQKMRFNAIMVHAYGNNPMVNFSFNGQTKPVGWLSTTVKGRDWSTMHVNDVRRLWGGEVFDQPVFGADAAKVPDDQRVHAAQQLMRDVFAFAEQRAMQVYFANDFDTPSANPQELILTLPPEARFSIKTKDAKWMSPPAAGFWLANPDVPEGYRYYKAQVEAMVKAYPQITCLVAWFRVGGTLWTELKLEEMPRAWQQEYQAEIVRTPEAARLWHAPQVFAMGKIVRAFDRALKELRPGRVQLAAGSWGFDFLAPCDRFFPPHVKLVGLDYEVLHDRSQLADEASRKVIRDVAAHRPVIPVIWAQHDDGNYLGRSYTPFPEFASKLADAKAGGFGVIHWTTRPLDLFFASHASQVWQSTKNQPLRDTCRDMAAKSFGESTRDKLGEYLERWVTDAPKFGRETTDSFIDRPLTNVLQVVAGCEERLKLLEAVDTSLLTPEQRDRVNYFRRLEGFIAAFHQTQDALQRSRALLKSGDRAGARMTMKACHPETVIEQFARFSSLGGITRGEQGLVVSLNLRWLPHFLRLRQALGLESVRYNFGPTSHDPLAQLPGKFTYHFDASHRIWQTLGAKETGAVASPADRHLDGNSNPALDEIASGRIESDQPIRLKLGPIATQRAAESRPPSDALLPAGVYRLTLFFADPLSTETGQRVFDIEVGGDAGVPPHRERVDIFQLAGKPGAVVERTFDVTLSRAGWIGIVLTPVTGNALINGLVLAPSSGAVPREQ